MEVFLYDLINSGRAYACQNMGGNEPIRDPTNTWYVSNETFSAEMYPDFCSGSVYLIRSQVAKKIYSVCNQTKFLWIDDVFVTGILREHYNNQLIDHNANEQLDLLSLNVRYNLSCQNELKLWCNTGLKEPIQYTFVLLNKDDMIRDMFCMWNKVRLLKFAVNTALAPNPFSNIG